MKEDEWKSKHECDEHAGDEYECDWYEQQE